MLAEGHGIAGSLISDDEIVALVATMRQQTLASDRYSLAADALADRQITSEQAGALLPEIHVGILQIRFAQTVLRERLAGKSEAPSAQAREQLPPLSRSICSAAGRHICFAAAATPSASSTPCSELSARLQALPEAGMSFGKKAGIGRMPSGRSSELPERAPSGSPEAAFENAAVQLSSLDAQVSLAAVETYTSAPDIERMRSDDLSLLADALLRSHPTVGTLD